MPRRVRLAEVAQARSGDKGNLANVAVFAPTDALYAAFLRELTAERVRAHFGRYVQGGVDRYEVANVRALNFVLHEALGGGGARSLRSDPLGKSYGSLLLRLEVDLSDDELASAPPRDRPTTDSASDARTR